MTVSFVRAGAWLLVQAAQFPDTVLMRQVGQERGWFEKTLGADEPAPALLSPAA